MVFKEAKAILARKCLMFLILKTDERISQFVHMNMNFTPPNAFKIFVCPKSNARAQKSTFNLCHAPQICLQDEKWLR